MLFWLNSSTTTSSTCLHKTALLIMLSFNAQTFQVLVFGVAFVVVVVGLACFFYLWFLLMFLLFFSHLSFLFVLTTWWLESQFLLCLESHQKMSLSKCCLVITLMDETAKFSSRMGREIQTLTETHVQLPNNITFSLENS